MPVTLMELLQPQLILDLVSRVRPGQGALGKWLGFQPNSFDAENVTLSGPATISGGALGPIRNVTYRVFNSTRTVPTARAPGTGPNTMTPNPVGAVQVTCPRFHDKIPLNYEFLGNLSPMTGPNSNIDSMGQDYIRQQTIYLATKYGKGVEMMAAGMMRDSLYFIQSGSTYRLSFTAPAAGEFGFQVNFQIPSTNKSQFAQAMGTDSTAGAIIDVSWDDPGAPILTHLMKIKAAFAQLHGYPLTDIWINSTMWMNVIQNTQVRNTGGSSNTVFAEYTMEPETGLSGGIPAKYAMVLRADPTVKWHINDDILSLGSDIDISYASVSTGSAAKLIPDTMAIFCTTPSTDVAKMYLGGEPVVENPGMPAIMRTGYYFWHEYTTQPSAIELIALMNAVPCLYIPTAFAPGTVVY